jgi:glutaredoxin-related protein
MEAYNSTALHDLIMLEQLEVKQSAEKAKQNPKNLAEASPASIGPTSAAKTFGHVARETGPTVSELAAHEVSFFVAELATVSHDDLDHPMRDAPPLCSDIEDDGVIMIDAVELEDEDVVMQDAPPLR